MKCLSHSLYFVLQVGPMLNGVECTCHNLSSKSRYLFDLILAMRKCALIVQRLSKIFADKYVK